MRLREFDIALRPIDESVDFFPGELPDPTGRSAEIKRAGLQPLPVRDEAPGAEDCPGPDHGAVHHNGTHPHQCPIPDRTGVEDHGMAHHHVLADKAGEIFLNMKHGKVLNVGVTAHFDPVDVAAQDGSRPDARVIAELDAALDHGRTGHEDILADLGSINGWHFL